MKNALISAAIAACVVATTAVPAAAQNEQRGGKTIVAAPTEVGGGTIVTKDRRVCVKSTYSNSRIPRMQCKSYGDWLASGEDPLATR